MRTIIAGSRDITDYNLIVQAVESAKNVGIDVSLVISGTARGVDKLGEWYAIENGLPIERYPADWKLGRGAGFIRNQQMSEVAEACIAITNGSNGTKDMIERARKQELKLFVLEVPK